MALSPASLPRLVFRVGGERLLVLAINPWSGRILLRPGPASSLGAADHTVDALAAAHQVRVCSQLAT